MQTRQEMQVGAGGGTGGGAGLGPEAPNAIGLLTIKEAASLAGVPFTWLKEKVDVGEIPCVKMRVRRRVLLAAVRAAIQRLAAGGYAEHLFGPLSGPNGPDPSQAEV